MTRPGPVSRFAERDTRIIALWLAGKTRPQICAEMDLTDGQVGRVIHRAVLRGELSGGRPATRPPTRRQQIEARVMAGESDGSIASAMGIKQVTVRARRSEMGVDGLGRRRSTGAPA